MVDCVWLCCLTYVIVWMSRVKASFKCWSILITNLGKQSSFSPSVFFFFFFFFFFLFFFVCVCVCAVALVISLFMIYTKRPSFAWSLVIGTLQACIYVIVAIDSVLITD